MTIYKCDICKNEILNNLRTICEFRELGTVNAYGYDICRKCEKQILKYIKEMKKNESR